MLAATVPAAAAQTVALDPVRVEATRGSPAPQESPAATVTLDSPALNSPVALTVDDALREDASFSLFRRTSSLISNPTSQGVSLREIGPSGASRSLVLLNGMPLNDPFGGWVLWNGAPRLSLRSAQIEQGGGSGTWGNAALAGAVELADDPFAAASPHGLAEAQAGAFGTRSAEAVAAALHGDFGAGIDARTFATDGFYVLSAGRRGAVDRPMSSRHQYARLTLRKNLGGAVQAGVTASAFDERRNNGTAYQGNATRLGMVTATVEGATPGALTWDVVGYAEREAFAATFSSVAGDRSEETPSNNQFAVPATAAGLSATALWDGIVLGADYRAVEGETREDYQYSGSGFARERYAGGGENFAGLFARRTWRSSPDWTWTLDLRADRWGLADGHSWDYARTPAASSAAPNALVAYPNRSGGELSPNAGVVWQVVRGWRLRAAVYRGFRVPTLNELYRPFRVGTVSTLANPALSPEVLTGGEAGAEWSAGPWQGRLTGFADQLHDAVGTAVQSSTPTLTTVQRSNFQSVRIRGAEAAAEWGPSSWLRIRLSYLFNDSRIQEARAEPDLVGLRLQEVPRHTVAATAEVLGWHGWTAEVRGRWVASQFDDVANTLVLPSALVADVAVSRRIGRRLALEAACENVANAAVTTSLSAAGLRTYDAPRMLRGGIRFSW